MIPSSDFTAISRFCPSDILWIPDFQDTQMSQWPWQTWWISLETFGSTGTMRGCWSWWWWWGCSQMLLQVQLAHHGGCPRWASDAMCGCRSIKTRCGFVCDGFSACWFQLTWSYLNKLRCEQRWKIARKAWRCLDVLGVPPNRLLLQVVKGFEDGVLFR